jgi:hypothetical protein
MGTKKAPKSARLTELEAERSEELRKKIVAIARATLHEDGVLEIDDTAEVSLGASAGSYVQAWVWVDNPERCADCGGTMTFKGQCLIRACTSRRAP